MTIREQLNSIAKKRVLILDGAMGSLIQGLNLDEKDYRGSLFAEHPAPLKGCNDLLCLTKPEAIGAIHDAYLEAGADIIETCSFNSNSITLSDYGLGHLSYEISAAAAGLARSSAENFSKNGKPRFVAGSIGSTAKGASLYPDVSNPEKRSVYWDELEAAYYDNARGLLDGGADILLIETIYDTLNAKAALFAVSCLLEERQIDVPIIISAAVCGETLPGRLLSGQTLEAFCISVMHADPWAIGLNCSFGAEKLLPHIRMLSKTVPCLVSAYPNAGLPDQSGRYEETPEVMSAGIETYLKEGLVNIVGGCCGSAPAHIAAIAEKAARYIPRTAADIDRSEASSPCSVASSSFFSGLEPFYAEGNTINIRNMALAAKLPALAVQKEEFQKSLSEGEYEDAADTARDLVEYGVPILDIKTDDENTIGKFLDYALMNPYIAKVPFMINSSRFKVLETGLKRLQGRSLSGPVNLEEGEAEFLRKVQLVHRYGAAAVISLADEQGLAVTNERKIEITQRVCNLLRKNNYPFKNIVIDSGTNWMPGTAGLDIFSSWIQDNCPGFLIAI